MLIELLVFPKTVLLREDVVLICTDEVGDGSSVLVELAASVWSACKVAVVV